MIPRLMRIKLHAMYYTLECGAREPSSRPSVLIDSSHTWLGDSVSTIRFQDKRQAQTTIGIDVSARLRIN